MKTYQAVTERILELCSKREITPNKLGTICGIEPSTITSIFYGKSKNPGLATINAICCGLEMTVFEFFDSPIFKQTFED